MTKRELQTIVDELGKSDNLSRQQSLYYFSAWLEYYESKEKQILSKSSIVVRACHLLGFVDVI